MKHKRQTFAEREGPRSMYGFNEQIKECYGINLTEGAWTYILQRSERE